MINKTEEWLYNKAKEVHKELELQDLYTSKFSFGGRWVMDLLEEYHKEQLLIQRVGWQSEQLPKYWQIKKEFITPELKKRFPSIIEWAFEKDWWINNNIAREEEIEPLSV